MCVLVGWASRDDTPRSGAVLSVPSYAQAPRTVVHPVRWCIQYEMVVRPPAAPTCWSVGSRQ